MDVIAIIVTFHPGLLQLRALLDRLEGEVDAVVVVDNGSDADLAALLAARGTGDVELIALGANLGLAAAQNRGLARARDRGCRHVVLFDQDSLPAAGMVGVLRHGAETRAAAGELIAAVGPGEVETGSGRDAAVPPAGGAVADGLVEADHLIASGCLIPVAALDRIGDMRAELFIDWVDVEWCLRARAGGLRCYRATGARMAHAFGEPVTILGRRFVWRPPLRHYYYFRNAVWLLRQRWIPASERLAHGGRVLRRLVLCLVLLRPRGAQWRMAWRGIGDGIAGRMGGAGS
ncbi:MAG: glycosyltransferase family 2 protein [Rhizobiales bacterium]|nr:glycosyltransferase family 2 protein [Hyphomicrobiales bacterium]